VFWEYYKALETKGSKFVIESLRKVICMIILYLGSEVHIKELELGASGSNL
jgi:hypothetical protein